MVGNNGVGKSTFLKLLIGQIEPVSDSVTNRLQTKLIALLSELYIGFVFLCGQISQKQSDVKLELRKRWVRTEHDFRFSLCRSNNNNDNNNSNLVKTYTQKKK